MSGGVLPWHEILISPLNLSSPSWSGFCICFGSVSIGFFSLSAGCLLFILILISLANVYVCVFVCVREAKCRVDKFVWTLPLAGSYLFIYFEAIALILLCLPSPGGRKDVDHSSDWGSSLSRMQCLHNLSRAFLAKESFLFAYRKHISIRPGRAGQHKKRIQAACANICLSTFVCLLCFLNDDPNRKENFLSRQSKVPLLLNTERNGKNYNFWFKECESNIGVLVT